MAGFFDSSKHRTVIPRWRLFATTTLLGELGGVSKRSPASPQFPSALEDLIGDFRLKKTPWHATDLLSNAFVLGQVQVAREAARFILEHATKVADPALDLAFKVLNGFDKEHDADPDWGSAIHANRDHLATFGNDPTRWADLGLAHTILGNRSQALRSMIVALQLAPSNRFIVRSAVRCFLHWGEADRAQSVARKAADGTNDPWLVAADLATTLARHRKPKNINAAKSLVENRSFHPHHVSELAIAIGGLEIESGSRRQAQKFVSIGMEDPTENSFAQVEWMLAQRDLPAPSIEHISDVPLLYEAKAVDRYAAGDWEHALVYATKWLDDQPFSSRPADMASYAAALLKRYDIASGLLEAAMKSNPCDVILINNLAYFQAMDERIDDAKRTFAKISSIDVTDDDRLITQATQGLLFMRTGATDAGRRLYRSTIDQALSKKKPDVRILAMLNFAREEQRAGEYDAAVNLLTAARSETSKLKLNNKEVMTMLKMTEDMIRREPAIL